MTTGQNDEEAGSASGSEDAPVDLSNGKDGPIEEYKPSAQKY
jgi:hypothetical protein